MFSPSFPTHTFLTTVLYVFPKDLLEVYVKVGLSSLLVVATVSQ